MSGYIRLVLPPSHKINHRMQSILKRIRQPLPALLSLVTTRRLWLVTYCCSLGLPPPPLPPLPSRVGVMLDELPQKCNSKKGRNLADANPAVRYYDTGIVLGENYCYSSLSPCCAMAIEPPVFFLLPFISSLALRV